MTGDRPDDATEPDDPDGSDPDRAWQDIVDHYGERPELPEDTGPEPETPAPDAAALRPLFRDRLARQEPPPMPGRDRLDGLDGEDGEDGFVPPEPPPLPTPPPLRRAAWMGLLGMPVLFVLLALLSITPPRAVTALLALWFAAGFGYLVATMRRGSGDADGWDNGAVV